MSEEELDKVMDELMKKHINELSIKSGFNRAIFVRQDILDRWDAEDAITTHDDKTASY